MKTETVRMRIDAKTKKAWIAAAKKSGIDNLSQWIHEQCSAALKNGKPQRKRA